jgi:hypothetical protein
MDVVYTSTPAPATRRRSTTRAAAPVARRLAQPRHPPLAALHRHMRRPVLPLLVPARHRAARGARCCGTTSLTSRCRRHGLAFRQGAIAAGCAVGDWRTTGLRHRAMGGEAMWTSPRRPSRNTPQAAPAAGVPRDRGKRRRRRRSRGHRTLSRPSSTSSTAHSGRPTTGRACRAILPPRAMLLGPTTAHQHGCHCLP